MERVDSVVFVHLVSIAPIHWVPAVLRQNLVVLVPRSAVAYRQDLRLVLLALWLATD